ncbi:MAG: monooxygenase FAD-binding protein [Caulobacteraceae bacterium]|nr:monooxygenase FAD-binding protein [Caulobacteraceae bacterium]
MPNATPIPVWREIGVTPSPTTGSERQRVVIVGGGPVGLAMALELGRRGQAVTLINRLDFIAAGSKAICFAKRSLDIFDQLGVGDAIVDKGVVWNVGKVFWGAEPEPIYQFDMLPVKAQHRPGFVNIQQYHVEEQLFEAAQALPLVDIRWGHAVVGVETCADGASLEIAAGDDRYRIDAEWVIAGDGSRSTVRELMGLDFEGRVFEDNFLIADVSLKEDRPAERHFWFDPPFNPGQSALLHRQPDNVWRLDFQLGWNIDREACIRPENVAPYVRGMLGDEVDFTPEWYSVYTFQCRRMASFVHGRVVFAGDSAHLVSPFGARGCNNGLADVANLGWKLDLALRGLAGPDLIESYNQEAIVTADENILNSTRSTDFMTPKTPVSRAFRDAVLELARKHPFARPFVNSGRLSTAVAFPSSRLSTDDGDPDWRGLAPGQPAIDAPLGEGWLLSRLGADFTLLANGLACQAPKGAGLLDVADETASGLLRDRYDLTAGSAYLIRPDQYVAARWRAPTTAAIEAAIRKAGGYA